jgi:hypothetical protein
LKSFSSKGKDEKNDKKKEDKKKEDKKASKPAEPVVWISDVYRLQRF